MESEKDSFSILNDYLGLDGRTLIMFVSLVVGVFIVVTGIYVSIFGFDTWKTNMQRAGSLMIINQEQPLPGANPGTLPPNQEPLQPEGPLPPNALNPLPAAAGGAVQYTCPNCGATGLPQVTQNGTLVCPNCHAIIGQNSPTGRALPRTTQQLGI